MLPYLMKIYPFFFAISGLFINQIVFDAKRLSCKMWH